jgi:hypothetical protein
MDRKEAPSVAAFRTIDERFAAIRELAYRHWEDRGRPDGSPVDDWYKAELTIDRGEDRQGGKADASDPPPGHARSESTHANPSRGISKNGTSDRTGKRKLSRARQAVGNESPDAVTSPAQPRRSKAALKSAKPAPQR